MDRHGKHRDNVYCAFESWLGGSWEGKGDIHRGYIMERFSRMEFGWICSQDWRRDWRSNWSEICA